MDPDPSPRLLLVEDDRRLAELLRRLLGAEGYDVELAPDGQSGLHLGLTRTFEVMVVDRGLPAVEGVELVRRLRSRGVTTPVLILTARGTSEDRVEGLDAGAEDYVVKPFDVEELLARLRALLRRHADVSRLVDLGHRSLDLTNRQVVGGAGPSVPLSQRECELLRCLALQPRRTFSRAELHDALFVGAESPNAVDTYVYYLRRKLGRESVRTIRGLGYRLGSA